MRNRVPLILILVLFVIGIAYIININYQIRVPPFQNNTITFKLSEIKIIPTEEEKQRAIQIALNDPFIKEKINDSDYHEISVLPLLYKIRLINKTENGENKILIGIIRTEKLLVILKLYKNYDGKLRLKVIEVEVDLKGNRIVKIKEYPEKEVIKIGEFN